jgi:hypothetical protein
LRKIISHLAEHFPNIWKKEFLVRSALVCLQVAGGIVPLVLAGDPQKYIAAEKFIATTGISCAVLFSFVYTLSVTTVARYKLKWRNVFTGGLGLTTGISMATILLMQISALSTLAPSVDEKHIVAAALLAIRNMVSPILITLNLVRPALYAEALGLALFLFGLLGLTHVVDLTSAVAAAMVLQSLPFLLIALRFIFKNGKIARPYVSFSDGVSGIFDAVFGSLFSNGPRLLLISQVGSGGVSALVVYRLGIGLAQAGAQAYFLFFGRQSIREITGSSGSFYRRIMLLTSIVMMIGLTSALAATVYDSYAALSVIFAATMFSAGICLYFLRFRIYGYHRAVVFLLLNLCLYGALQTSYAVFVPIACAVVLVGSTVIGVRMAFLSRPSADGEY